MASEGRITQSRFGGLGLRAVPIRRTALFGGLFWGSPCLGKLPYVPFSKLLVAPLITLIVIPYI